MVIESDGRVAYIPVPESAVDKDDPYDLVFAVVTLVNRTLFQGGFVREELPDAIFQSYGVDYYLTQVNNGGHTQFAANSGLLDATMADIRAGLAAMGDPVAASIFRDFEARRATDPARFDAAIASGPHGDHMLDDLDDRFFAGPSKTLLATNAAWLRTLPQLRPIADDAYEEAITTLLASNPHAPARIAERHAFVEAWQDRDPFVQALRFLCERPDSGILFKRWLAGSPIETPEGGKGGYWVVMTNRGRADIWMLADRMMFRLQDGTGPLVTLPTETVRHAVRTRTGEDIPVEAFGLFAHDAALPLPDTGGWFRAALRRVRLGLFGR